MAYEVTIKRTAACPTAVVKADTTQVEFPALWLPLLNEVWAFLGARPGLRTDGHNVMLYRNDVPDVELAVEVGVQVTGPFEAVGRVARSTLPAAEAAVAVHTGPPAEIGAAHDAVRAVALRAPSRVDRPLVEIYRDTRAADRQLRRRGVLAAQLTESGRPPTCDTAGCDANRHPAASAASGPAPSSQGGRNPPANASPAPAVSTTSVLFAGALIEPAVLRQSAPSSPSLTTTSLKRSVSLRAASPGSAQPVRTRASSRLASSRSTLSTASRNVSGPSAERSG